MSTVPRATVMVVDDEPQVCDAVARALVGDGHRVSTMTDGERALALFPAVRPDIVLLDVVLPGIDGLTTFRELRARGYRGPVVMLSGHATLHSAREAMLLGAYDYIAKPFRMRLLRSVVEGALEDQVPGCREPTCAS